MKSSSRLLHNYVFIPFSGLNVMQRQEKNTGCFNLTDSFAYGTERKRMSANVHV